MEKERPEDRLTAGGPGEVPARRNSRSTGGDQSGQSTLQTSRSQREGDVDRNTGLGSRASSLLLRVRGVGCESEKEAFGDNGGQSGPKLKFSFGFI